MRNISRRRQIITAVLLLLAVGGGVARWLAPRPSLAHDMGSLLLVLWLPIVGNIIAWLVARAHAMKPAPPGFDPAAAFVPSARVEITLLAADTPVESRPIRPGLFPCALVVGNEGFSARLQVERDQVPLPEVTQALQVQFLRPELARERLPAGASFTLLAGRTALGCGTVLEHVGP